MADADAPHDPDEPVPATTDGSNAGAGAGTGTTAGGDTTTPSESDDSRLNTLETDSLRSRGGHDFVAAAGYMLLGSTFIVWILLSPEFQVLKWWTIVALLLIAGKESLETVIEALAGR